MKRNDFDFVALEDLRIGLFVDLDLGWMAHPFATSRFKISSARQIEVLKVPFLKRTEGHDTFALCDESQERDGQIITAEEDRSP